MKYHLKLAKKSYMKIVWEIRNNEEIRKHLLDKRAIPYSVHKKVYVNKYIPNDNWMIYIIIRNNIPVGYCDIKIDNSIEVGFKILPKYQRKGAGSYAVESVIEMCSSINDNYKILLTVLTKNHGAIKLYKKYGFRYEKSFVNKIGINRDESVDVMVLDNKK